MVRNCKDWTTNQNAMQCWEDEQWVKLNWTALKAFDVWGWKISTRLREQSQSNEQSASDLHRDSTGHLEIRTSNFQQHPQAFSALSWKALYFEGPNWNFDEYQPSWCEWGQCSPCTSSLPSRHRRGRRSSNRDLRIQYFNLELQRLQ